jgi:AcrR family transcriptional regulator
MARVDLARRAQIGQERRARTRAQLIEAARDLIASRAVETITIDDIVKGAGVAKGTFYVHFADMNALIVAVAADLIESFTEIFQPLRAAISDPVLRIALGCSSFVDKAIESRAWGAVVARMAFSHPWVGSTTRQGLAEDIRQFHDEAPRGDRAADPDVAIEIVVAIVLQALGAISQGRLGAAHAPAIMEAMLRAIGVGPQRIRTTLATVEKIKRSGASPE